MVVRTSHGGYASGCHRGVVVDRALHTLFMWCLSELLRRRQGMTILSRIGVCP